MTHSLNHCRDEAPMESDIEMTFGLDNQEDHFLLGGTTNLGLELFRPKVHKIGEVLEVRIPAAGEIRFRS
jgi:hypothetical protein